MMLCCTFNMFVSNQIKAAKDAVEVVSSQYGRGDLVKLIIFGNVLVMLFFKKEKNKQDFIMKISLTLRHHC